MKADKAKEKTARETKVRCESSGKSGGQKGGNFVDEEMTLTAVQHEEGQIAFRLAHLRLTLHATLIAAAALLVILGLVAYYILSPNPVLRSGDAVVLWEFLDKRAMLSVYVMNLLFLAFLKFLSGICSPPPLLTPNGTGLTMERGPCRPFD